MVLAVDIGNSSISCGVFQRPDTLSLHQQEPKCVCRFKIASKQLSADEYLLLFSQFLHFHRIRPADSFFDFNDTLIPPKTDRTLHSCVIASVVPSLTDMITKICRTLTGSQPMLISPGIRTGFGIKIRNPEQLGADIVANIAGAFLFAEAPFVVLDVGTATTITFVNVNKELTGTIIIPGLSVSMAALTDSAALLSPAGLEHPQELLGKTTNEAIRSGVVGGHAIMIDGFLRNIREQYNAEINDQKLQLIATGGLANAVLPYCRNKFCYTEDLTLLGALHLLLKNKMVND